MGLENSFHIDRYPDKEIDQRERGEGKMKVKILGLRKVQLSHVGQILITLRTGQILPTVQDFAFTIFV